MEWCKFTSIEDWLFFNRKSRKKVVCDQLQMRKELSRLCIPCTQT